MASRGHLKVCSLNHAKSDKDRTCDHATNLRRPALSFMRTGDTLVVWKLDRLARSLKQLMETVEDLSARGIGFRSLTEAIDTTTSGGRLVFHIFGALAEFERGIIRERTTPGSMPPAPVAASAAVPRRSTPMISPSPARC